MEKLLVKGKQKLMGQVKISGAKNAAVAILPATIVAGAPCTIENLPNISDVKVLTEMLAELGAKITWHDEHTVTIDPTTTNTFHAPYKLAKKLRASYYLMGALLARFKMSKVALPGGCQIGPRPMDQHLKGFEAVGAQVTIASGEVDLKANEFCGGSVYMDIVTVGATINTMLAASRCPNLTIIENAAKEPEVVDVANFLNAIGVTVKGAGTDIIKIQGSEELHGCVHSVIPDRIEAGTFMVAAAATNGNVKVCEVIPKHLEPITAKLREAGVEVEEGDDYIHIKAENKRPIPIDVKTFPYPGYPTDLQQPMMAFLSRCAGASLITENIFENRFQHVDELNRMGANIKVEGRTAIIEGVENLQGAEVKATDLRAGSALVIAGLMAEGITKISDVSHIKRGYENIDKKFASLGVDISYIEE
ncbi:UDP-N-acetylglucosamine 1-carboxyvinyltransferase [Alkalicella caledoniensis]|uniref:UDP-N-acetylglucosamine 1-carboxyvinyltransferase n=1 Tax=Alkalicella caledoniensis TaxID=2731377 RepID=A0A7G9W8M9_ALKCA|nr:UDP-N-acetylglucosamine 1-carboxyvinyltransferase [Alkalicella caledoniensis]QNO15041.1 UDP-N-acetylglucosamine 1-carboxyvinyltransferase [Alkalicella caledoniensis]